MILLKLGRLAVLKLVGLFKSQLARAAGIFGQRNIISSTVGSAIVQRSPTIVFHKEPY